MRRAGAVPAGDARRGHALPRRPSVVAATRAGARLGGGARRRAGGVGGRGSAVGGGCVPRCGHRPHRHASEVRHRPDGVAAPASGRTRDRRGLGRQARARGGRADRGRPGRRRLAGAVRRQGRAPARRRSGLRPGRGEGARRVHRGGRVGARLEAQSPRARGLRLDGRRDPGREDRRAVPRRAVAAAGGAIEVVIYTVTLCVCHDEKFVKTHTL
mmetsp:Transcript_357/g.962  ORF Transcript_357/g.962 Transcript_357/m.962 type:complete len:214 (+) Transcript_357:499-1140(+)